MGAGIQSAWCLSSRSQSGDVSTAHGFRPRGPPSFRGEVTAGQALLCVPEDAETSSTLADSNLAGERNDRSVGALAICYFRS